jgi:hypothetical protein
MPERDQAGELLTGSEITVTDRAPPDTSSVHLSSTRRADDRLSLPQCATSGRLGPAPARARLGRGRGVWLARRLAAALVRDAVVRTRPATALAGSSTAGAVVRAVRTPAPVPKREPRMFRLTSLDRHTSLIHRYGTPRRRSAAKSLLRSMSVSLDVRPTACQPTISGPGVAKAAGRRRRPRERRRVGCRRRRCRSARR